jgi:hypothetical protein
MFKKWTWETIQLDTNQSKETPCSKKRYGCKWIWQTIQLYTLDTNKSKETGLLLLFFVSQSHTFRHELKWRNSAFNTVLHFTITVESSGKYICFKYGHNLFVYFWQNNLQNVSGKKSNNAIIIFDIHMYQLLRYIPMFMIMVFNATFNNISVMSWRLVLLVEETREILGYSVTIVI